VRPWNNRYAAHLIAVFPSRPRLTASLKELFGDLKDFVATGAIPRERVFEPPIVGERSTPSEAVQTVHTVGSSLRWMRRGHKGVLEVDVGRTSRM
jgi:hypothetical protein